MPKKPDLEAIYGDDEPAAARKPQPKTRTVTSKWENLAGEHDSHEVDNETGQVVKPAPPVGFPRPPAPEPEPPPTGGVKQDHFKKKKAKADKPPAKKSKKKMLPTQLTRSCIFYPMKNAYFIPGDKPIETEIFNGRIIQKYKMLCSKHMRIMLWILAEVKRTNNSSMRFEKKQLMQFYFGGTHWSSKEYEEMDKLVREMTEAWFHLEYTFNGKKVKMYSYLMSYLEEYDPDKEEDKNHIGINVNRLLLNLIMEKYTTLLDDDKLRVMKKVGTRILYAFLKGYEPFYKGLLVTMKPETLYKAMGLRTVAKLKGWYPWQKKKVLEDALDELNSMDELDVTLEYEEVKGKGKKRRVINHYGWKYDKLRDLYVIRKRVPTQAELEAKAEKKKKELAQPIEVQRLAQDAAHIWRMHRETSHVHIHKSVFTNVAKRAQKLFDEVGHRLANNFGGTNGIHHLLELSLDILFKKGTPAGGHFWAQPLFWEQELPFQLHDLGYLEPEGGMGFLGMDACTPTPKQWEREQRMLVNRGVPMRPEDADPCPDYED